MDTQLSGNRNVFFQIIAAGKDRLVIYQKFGKAQLTRLMHRTVYALKYWEKQGLLSLSYTAGESVPTGIAFLTFVRKEECGSSAEDRGSIMTVLATDLPVSERQLYRIIRRCGVGIARTGAYTGHGSGEIMIGFTTANLSLIHIWHPW